MRTLLLFVFLCGYANICEAQQNYFVYLQTDNKQPFYVKVNEKVFSSSSSGYVVIPKLPNGNHVFSIGFPKNEWPQQVIPVSVSGKDLGYILKNFDTKGWGLFNMQTLDVVMSNGSLPAGSGTAKATTRTDEFSNTLADVVNTPSIKEISGEEGKKQELPKSAEPMNPVTGTEKTEPAPAPPPAAAVVTIQENTTSTNTNKTIAAVPDTAALKAALVPGGITKISTSSTADAIVMSYLVQNDGSPVVDTVQVVILVPEPVSAVEATAVQDITPAKDSPAISSTVKIATPADLPAPKFIDIEFANPNTPADSNIKDTALQQAPVVNLDKNTAPQVTQTTVAPVKEPVGTLKMINSDCKSTAGEEDFLKIRKKMIAQKEEDEMINAAQKLFRQKCYSTEQVKNLSVLLLKQESKYKFFDTAYPFVYDSTNFRELESQLTDTYFVSRFRAMIRK